eukprot:CAMPEP_0169278334 /NCGR_PEP_ID=MMETSP1016-20121227/54250_1 /TAXON_ID=342587 /ORGANISM="Karlodinium micrum, Strain CCMP2283" /LENGTH=236 /DNA_ID=CAMNT_0009366049 /DNA_START=27 /DNA_END=737 /DNA_ORIENTATION=-
MGSVKAMGWSMILLFTLLLMLSILIMQGVTEHMLDAGDSISLETKQELDQYWSSLFTGLLYLYMATTGGEDWHRIINPLAKCGWFLYASFIFYIFIYFCVIGNVFTSLFVQGAMEHMDRDQQHMIQAELDKKDEYVKMLRGWYQTIDTDGSGEITLDELVEAIEAPEMLAFASRMGIEALDVKQFFAVLSANGKRTSRLGHFCCWVHQVERYGKKHGFDGYELRATAFCNLRRTTV